MLLPIVIWITKVIKKDAEIIKIFRPTNAIFIVKGMDYTSFTFFIFLFASLRLGHEFADAGEAFEVNLKSLEVSVDRNLVKI
jgi:hypothetical protein